MIEIKETFEVNYEEKFDIESSLIKARLFYESAQRSCCPTPFPDYMPRNPLLQKIQGEHAIPSPPMPFWWSENVINSPQLNKFPWLKEVLVGVTWQELMEGKISNKKFREHRQNWSVEQRKQVSSPKIGGMLNIIFHVDPEPLKKYVNRKEQVSRLPFWWYWVSLEARSMSNTSVSRFLAKTTVEEFNSGEFSPERYEQLKGLKLKKRLKNAKIEDLLHQIFYEYPSVLTKFNQRGGKTLYTMRVTTDPYSIVTMSTRSPHWTSCMNPVRNDSHEQSHRLWANLLDSNMAVLEMINPDEEVGSNLVARAVLRIVKDHKQDLLYLDCLYGERGYVTSFVALTRRLAQSIGLVPVSGRMIPFYTSFNTPLSGYPMDFKHYEPPHLDLGEWKRQNGLYVFSGEGHYLHSV